MKSSPIGGITSNQPNHNYMDVVLESLCALETSKDIFLKRNNTYVNLTFLTKEFVNLLYAVQNNPNIVNSTAITNAYFNMAKSKNDNQALFNNPYNFLSFFFEFLDEEYNKSYNIPKNIPVSAFQDINGAINNLDYYLHNTQTSIISQNYFFYVILNYRCNYCRNIRYEWIKEKTIDLDINVFKGMVRRPISLSECFQYYASGKYTNCRNCGQMNQAVQSRQFYSTGKALIIKLIKNAQINGQNDNDFIIDFNLDISRFKAPSKMSNYNNFYTLKSRIGFAGQFGYFVDCLIKRDNLPGTWYRYCNGQNREMGIQEIQQYEPLILIYEIGSNMAPNNMNNSYPVSNMGYNNMNNNMMMNNRPPYNQNNNMNYNNMNRNMNQNVPNNNLYQNTNNNYNNPNNNYNMNYNPPPQNNNYNINNNMRPNTNYNNLSQSVNYNQGNYQNMNNNLTAPQNRTMINNPSQNLNVNPNKNLSQSVNNMYNSGGWNNQNQNMNNNVNTMNSYQNMNYNNNMNPNQNPNINNNMMNNQNPNMNNNMNLNPNMNNFFWGLFL